MRYLTLGEVLEIHSRIMRAAGSTLGVHSLAELESAVAQPRMTFGRQELYQTLAEKASALGLSLIQNHPFVDGNKRTGHAALETFLVLNGPEIAATVDEQFTGCRCRRNKSRRIHSMAARSHRPEIIS